MIDQLESQPGWGQESPVEGLTVVVNNNQIVNEIDQSLHVDGEVHGDIIQQNSSNVANATGEGAVAGEYVEDNQIQTGDGQQVGGDSGVQNQGDNSGQQAGGNADADNITTGNENTVGSGEASHIGQGQETLEDVSFNDSSAAFGSGYAQNTSNDTEDSHDSESYSDTTDGSYNSEYSDDDTQTQTVEVHGYEEEGYEPPHEGEDHKGYSDHDDYDDHHGPEGYEVEQDQAIIDAN